MHPKARPEPWGFLFMLYNTFIHIPGIGKKTEQQIWDAGILSWNDWKEPFPKKLSAAKQQLISHHLSYFKNQKNLESPFYYGKLLPSNQHWRLFPHYRDKIAYFDIETNGRREECEITTICLYDGKTVRSYVQGRNLDDFIDDITAYDIIVTYNG